MMCNEQVDTENTTLNLYSVTAEQPGRPVNWQYVSSGGRQHDTLVQPPSQSVETGSAGAFCSMTGHRAAMSDGGNSRDSWSSTSSNGVGCQPVVQPWSTYYCPPRQLTQYRGSVNQQQQYHLYDRAHHHTWGQVETNQSRCDQVYPQHQQHRQRFYCTNQRPHSGQPTQHPYLQSTPAVHPHHQHGTPCLPAASYPGMTSNMTTIQQVHTIQTHPPSQLISHHFGAPHSEPGSVWTGTRDQCIEGTLSRQPLATYSQLSTSPPTLAPWYRVNYPDGNSVLAEQQQHASVLMCDSSNQSLPWSPDAPYNISFND